MSLTMTMAELYDQYYSVYPDKANLYRGDTEMPNHCHNRVTFYSANTDDVAKLKQIFEDENTFGQIIPEPDWPNTPNKDGELPVKHEDPWLTYRWSNGRQDDRWYDWRLQNWDTKGDCYDVNIVDDDPENMEIEFNTAWSPPEAICNEIREQYPDVSVSWFYDEPGCEIAGYL